MSLAYIVTIVSFIVALRFLSDPRKGKARQLGRRRRHGDGHRCDVLPARPRLGQFVWVIIVMAVTAPIGAYAARAVKMTAMPQMVALFNGVGGGAAASDRPRGLPRLDRGARRPRSQRLRRDRALGADRLFSFAGSMIAFAKLQELMAGRPMTYPGPEVLKFPVARSGARARNRDRRRGRE